MKELREVSTMNIIPELPEELWSLILSFLDPESLINSVELVSKKFHNLANDNLLWKQLFLSFFPKDLPSPLPENFKWKNEFINLYLEQYGFLPPETRKLIFLIATNALDTIRTLTISIEDLKANSLVLIKTATRLNRPEILEHFYSICEPEFQARPEPENELELLRWAVLRNRGKPDELTLGTIGLALEGGLSDLSRELLASPENPHINFHSFVKLLPSVIRSGQNYMLRACDNFIDDYTKLNSKGEFRTIRKLRRNEVIELAASNGIIPIFSRFANQLQQGITQKEQELNEANTSFSKEKIAKLSAKLKRAKTKFEHAMASAMRSAAEHGHIDLIKYALKKQFISINQKCGYTTLLAQATESGQDNLMQFLLDNGADPEEGLYLIVNTSCDSTLQNGIFTLLNAIEERGELKNIKLLEKCSIKGRLDLLERLFDLDQGRLIKPDTIQKLLSEHCPVECRNFLQEKLAQAQSAIALKASAEEQPHDSSSDEAENFFRAGFQHPAPRVEFAHSHFFAPAAFQATATDQPEELWSLILSFLDPESLINSVELVSKKFHNLANDNLLWKQLFLSFFPKDLPSPIPENFKWKNEFINLYLEQYGFLPPETRKLIFLIATNDLATIRTLTISIEDLKANSLVLIKTATRLNRPEILEHFYSICEPEFQARPEPENELELLRWAVLRNRGKPDELTLETIGLALEGGLSDLSREFLTSPEIQVSYNVIELRQLLTSAMRSGQRDIMTAYDNFMADCKKLNSANESIVDLVEESQDIYSLLKFAALEGIIPIFNQLANRLQQEITQKEQELNETQTSFSKEKIAKLSANLKRAKTKFEDAMASAMRSAAEHGHIDLIKYALKKQFISINQKCEYTTLLAQATESRQDNLMQFLLDNGADPEEGLYIILIRIVNSSYNSILKHILKPGVFTLLKAIEKRGELKSIKLIQQCSVNGRLDLLVRLFDLDQGRLIKPDTIQKLLSKDCPVKCRNFLQKKLAQAQSAIALKASAEEQPNDSSSDEAEDFFRAGFQHPAPRVEFAHSHFFAPTAFQATATDQAEEQPNDSSSDEAEDFFRAGFQHPAPRIEFAHSHFFASAAFQATVTEQAEEQPNDSSSDEAEDFFRADFQHPAPRVEFAHSHFFAPAAFQATATDQDDKATKHTEVSFGG